MNEFRAINRRLEARLEAIGRRMTKLAQEERDPSLPAFVRWLNRREVDAARRDARDAEG